MTNPFAVQGARYNNEVKRSIGALVGIAQGLLADGRLVDDEVLFLRNWLAENEPVATSWPGAVVADTVRDVLEDGVITEAERAHLVGVLQQLVGGAIEDLASSTHVTELAIDAVDEIRFDGATFCFTGEFVYGTRDRCSAEVQARGGTVINNVTKKLAYLVLGGLGSDEWKHGSFGTKVEKAMEYKRKGVPILVVHEEAWTRALGARPPAWFSTGSTA